VPTGSNSKSFFNNKSVHVYSRLNTALYMGRIDSILSVTMPPQISDQKNCTFEKHSQLCIFLMITIWNTCWYTLNYLVMRIYPYWDLCDFSWSSSKTSRFSTSSLILFWIYSWVSFTKGVSSDIAYEDSSCDDNSLTSSILSGLLTISYYSPLL
jgi:hypothetical protein